jgi:uncharacterized protein (DUF4415 family)
MSEKDGVTPELDDSPELTEQDFARAISFGDVLLREAMRPRADPGSFAHDTVALALDADLVRKIQASGPNYKARVEAVLDQALADGRI